MTKEETKDLFVHLMYEVHNVGIGITQKTIDNATAADKLFKIAQTLDSIADKIKKEKK